MMAKTRVSFRSSPVAPSPVASGVPASDSGDGTANEEFDADKGRSIACGNAADPDDAGLRGSGGGSSLAHSV